MKNASECLKCGHETIWEIDPLSIWDMSASNVVEPLPVACRMVDNQDPGIFGRHTVRKHVGRFVAYVCASCGYSEMYAADIEELAKLQSGHEGSVVTKHRPT